MAHAVHQNGRIGTVEHVSQCHEGHVRHQIVIAALYAVSASASPLRVASAQDSVPALERYLRQMGLSSKELAAAAHGRAVAKLRPTQNENDVTVFAVIGVNAPRDIVISYARDAERFLSAKGRQFAVLGNPPESTDVRGLSFDESEYRSLRSCRPRDCRFKLPEEWMTAFAERVDWSARDAKGQADEILRDALVRLAVDYRSRGSPATLPYDDGRGVRPGDVSTELAARSADLYTYAAELERYLTTYPSAPPIGAHDYPVLGRGPSPQAQADDHPQSRRHPCAARRLGRRGVHRVEAALREPLLRGWVRADRRCGRQ